MELFRLFGTVGLNGVNETENQLSSVTGKAEKSSNAMVSAFKKIGKAVIAYFAIEKIKQFGTALVNTAAEVAAEEAAFTQIMGEYSDAAAEKVSKIADATGMVDTRLTPYMTSMTAKFKGLGYDVEEATDLASTGLTIAADAAAFWDKSLEDSMGSLNSFVNGNYEGGEAIGLFANETTLASWASENLGLKWADLTEKEKQFARLQFAKAMQEASGATGQAAKESDAYQNVLGNLKETWRQLLATVGQPVLEAIIPIMQKLSEKAAALKAWLDSNKEALDKVKNAIGTAIDILWGFIDVIGAVIGWLFQHEWALKVVAAALGVLTGLWATTKIATFMINVGGLTGLLKLLTIEQLKNIAAKITDKAETLALIGLYAKDAVVKGLSMAKTVVLTAATWAATAAQWALNAAMSANPIGIIILLIAALVAAFVALWNKCEGFRNFWISLWECIRNVASAAWNAIKAVFSAVGSFFKNVFQQAYNAVTSVFSKIGTFFVGIWNKIKNTFSKLGTTIGNAISGAVKAGINGIISLIERRINSAINFINGAINLINKIPGVNISKISALKLPRLENGGVLEKGQVGLLEGTGAEAVVPLENNKKWLSALAQDLNEIQGGSTAYIFQKLIDMLAGYFPQMIDLMDKDIILDDGTLVGRMAPKINNKLAEIQTANVRGR